MIISHVYAAIQNPVVPGGTHPKNGANTLGYLIAILWRTIIIVGGLAFLLFFLWGCKLKIWS